MTDAIVALIEGALSWPWGLLALAAVAAVDVVTSLGRARRNRATSGSPIWTGRANDGQSVDAAEPGLRG
jgi:hypothetical protein